MPIRLPVSARLLARRHAGITLIEVLVGVAIGLISMLVMFQMLSVWDARTKASSAVGDAQVAGSMAMYNVERDLKLAGMGFSPNALAPVPLGCNVNAFDNDTGLAADFALLPVVITDGDAMGVPDRIEVLYGTSPFLGDGLEFASTTPTTLTATPSKFGLKRGDVAVMTMPAGVCRLIEITADADPDIHLLTFDTTPYISHYSGVLQPEVRWNSGASPPAIPSGQIYSLGPTPRRNAWSIDTATSTLGFTNRMARVNPDEFFAVAEGVVDMKAQYGYDANGDNRIDDGEWTKAVPADWTRVRAVRVALLVRSRDFAAPKGDAEAQVYKLTDAQAPRWSAGAFAMKNLNGSTGDIAGDPNNWRYYRYRVYEKVVPLRNMIWGQTQ